jgi:hypothetical protein
MSNTSFKSANDQTVDYRVLKRTRSDSESERQDDSQGEYENQQNHRTLQLEIRKKFRMDNIQILEKMAWLGEDKTTRTSPRASSLDKEPSLFPGISTIDDCARSLNSFCLVMCYNLNIKDTFNAMILAMKQFGIAADVKDFDKWTNFISNKGKDTVGRPKSQKQFWEYSFYEDRRDEHYRLKWSLAHPSRHFTNEALDDSWLGIKTFEGHIEAPDQLRPEPLFGIVTAK